MILADTSVWIDHFRLGNKRLQSLLEAGEIMSHPFVVGELACGTMGNREEILTLLSVLPAAVVAEHDEVLHFVERHELDGSGLGWVDVHLLASAKLTKCSLWTLDKSLSRIARKLDVSA
jgi:predicted nucleic acid-binding protein